MFYHGYENYMKHAFPEDELRPISCQPLTRDRANPGHIELNDALGNYSLTLIDSLSTLAILASSSSYAGKPNNKALEYFQDGMVALVEQYGDGTDGPAGQGKRAKGFNVDSKVQVFETVIRGVGGLVSAHQFAVGDLPISAHVLHGSDGEDFNRYGKIGWLNGFNYDGQLLRLALDLASRLLPAFQTTTGIPYPRVNLRYGIPFYANAPSNNNAEYGQCVAGEQRAGERTETCAAGAGSLILEFTTLSRLTGIPVFEQLAKRAFWSVWERRSALELVGSGLDAESGLWTNSYTGIGAGIDSFYEYAAKSYILLSGSPSSINAESNNPGVALAMDGLTKDEYELAESYLQIWQTSHTAIHRHLRRGETFIHPHYIQGDLFTGSPRAFWFDSLSAFYPGLLALTGDVEEAVQAQLLFTAIWSRYSAIPERWSAHAGGIEGGLNWWGGRPEFVESNFHLYRATQDPWYLHVGEMILRDIKRRSWTKCGWAGIQDVRTGEKSDRMESFFLSETSKYLFLLFDHDHPLNKLDAPFVFTTEGHPLIIPKRLRLKHTDRQSGLRFPEAKKITDISDQVCPVEHRLEAFGLSATAGRADLFHAANLARLHLMPTPQTVESPLVEYSTDHPSISISDVSSPSNYTYFPWTLPLELVPPKAICSTIQSSPTFEISFPQDVGTLLGFGMLQRIANGILINSIKGVRLGMIQDVPISSEEGKGNLYRVQTINNVPLGKDENVFLPRNVINDAVNPQDPNFTRVRDISMLDVVVDVAPQDPSSTHESLSTGSSGPSTEGSHNSTSSLIPVQPSPRLSNNEEGDSSSPVKVAFDSLIQQVTNLLHDTSTHIPKPSPLTRHYIPAITPSGAGAAPLPDIEEALGPDIHGNPQGGLHWHTVFTTNQNCDAPLPSWVVQTHQILVIKRGTCSFSQKIQNVPAFAPSSTSLQLVIVVSYDEQNEEDGLPPGYLIRPLMDDMQMTPKGLPRYRPISMVLVAGGEETYGMFERAKGVGVKRRWRIEAQGVRISNLIVT